MSDRIITKPLQIGFDQPLRTEYEWVVEEWDGSPVHLDSDILDQSMDERLDDVLLHVPIGIRPKVIREAAAQDSEGRWWSVSLWKSTGNEQQGLGNRWEAYMDDLERGTFPGGSKIPRRFTDELAAARVANPG